MCRTVNLNTNHSLSFFFFCVCHWVCVCLRLWPIFRVVPFVPSPLLFPHFHFAISWHVLIMSIIHVSCSRFHKILTANEKKKVKRKVTIRIHSCWISLGEQKHRRSMRANNDKTWQHLCTIRIQYEQHIHALVHTRTQPHMSSDIYQYTSFFFDFIISRVLNCFLCFIGRARGHCGNVRLEQMSDWWWALDWYITIVSWINKYENGDHDV